MFVEEANGLCRHTVLIGFFALHNKLKLLAFLVVLELFLRINILVLDVKRLVFEILHDLDVCLEIDRSLSIAVTNNTSALLVEPLVICCHPIVLSEFSWTLI